jgi:prepilin-type N-terminal cleavage/methylation domain-containing protein
MNKLPFSRCARRTLQNVRPFVGCAAHNPHPVGCAVRTIDPRTVQPTQHNGYTLIEMLIALALSAILFAGIGSVVGQVINTREAVQDKNDLTGQGRFAMQQMVRAVHRSPHLLLPLLDNPSTNWREHVREQTVPASAPEGDSTLATAVLAVIQDRSVDLDGDGTPDADNDGDGRFDEDPPGDNNYDNAPGILQIDDDGDGEVDVSASIKPLQDNDEDDNHTEDTSDGLDNDGDGSVDEDLASDLNGDGCSGSCSVDDDSDGVLDEAHQHDDDEDGTFQEDWYDPVVFYLNGATLMQRTPVPWDENASGFVTGADFVEHVVAENVTRFRVERIPQHGRRQLVDLTLELTSPASGETVSLTTRVRVGGAL